jgi:hypothetical protein
LFRDAGTAVAGRTGRKTRVPQSLTSRSNVLYRGMHDATPLIASLRQPADDLAGGSLDCA